MFANSTAADAAWAIEVKKAWNGAKGDTYCQFSWNYIEGWRSEGDWRTGVGLMRVDKTLNVWEANFRRWSEELSYPDQIDPKARHYEDQRYPAYFIYHRKQ